MLLLELWMSNIGWLICFVKLIGEIFFNLLLLVLNCLCIIFLLVKYCVLLIICLRFVILVKLVVYLNVLGCLIIVISVV